MFSGPFPLSELQVSLGRIHISSPALGPYRVPDTSQVLKKWLLDEGLGMELKEAGLEGQGRAPRLGSELHLWGCV